jgi:predicted nucleic acid-binding protein
MNTQTDHIIEEAMQLPLDELKAVSERILEEIEEREWDRVLQSPEGLADNEQEYQKTIEAIKTGNIVKYIPGKSLAELFQR